MQKQNVSNLNKKIIFNEISKLFDQVFKSIFIIIEMAVVNYYDV